MIFLDSLYIFAIAAVILVILGVFRSNLFNRLSTRIIVLILAVGPITAILFSISTKILLRLGVLIGAPDSFSTFVLYALITLGLPVVLGLLAAHFIRRPLRQFNNAIASLEQSDYKVKLRPTGVYEFDEVFTKFNNLTNRLQREEKLRKDLVSDASHELNTPLTTMIGQLTAMQEGKYLMTKERVSILKEQAERLAELVRQLDTYTKARMPDADKPEDIHFKEFCEELVDNFALELKEKGLTVKLHISEDYILRVNRDAIQQILTNLMQNTLRYSQATEVIIKTTASTLLFSDNGRGVPTQSLPYLFERFYRVDESRSRATGGLGLGLAIVKELVESQGWSIAATASQPGLTFVLKIA